MHTMPPRRPPRNPDDDTARDNVIQLPGTAQSVTPVPALVGESANLLSDQTEELRNLLKRWTPTLEQRLFLETIHHCYEEEMPPCFPTWQRQHKARHQVWISPPTWAAWNRTPFQDALRLLFVHEDTDAERQMRSAAIRNAIVSAALNPKATPEDRKLAAQIDGLLKPAESNVQLTLMSQVLSEQANRPNGWMENDHVE